MNRRIPLGIGALLLAAAMMNVAYTMLIPLVPELTGRFAMTPLQLAAVFGGFALAKGLAQPIGGVLVDRVPRLALLGMAGLLLTAAATAGLAFAATGPELIGWRLAWGVAEGLTMPVLYRLAVLLGSRSTVGETRMLGWFGAACVAGMTLGPALVGILHVSIGFAGVFVTGAALTAVSGLLLLAVPADRPATVAATPAPVEGNQPRRRGRPFWGLVALVGVFAVMDLVNNAVFAALEPVLPLHVDAMVDGSSVATMSVLYTVGLCVFMVVCATFGKMIDRRPLLTTSAVGFAVMALGLVTIGLVDGMVALWIGFLLFMATQPMLYVIARRGVALVPQHQLGRAYGGFGLVSDAGFMLGPLVGVLLYTWLGDAAFSTMAVVIGLAAVAAFAGRRLPDRLLAVSTASPAPLRPAQPQPSDAG